MQKSLFLFIVVILLAACTESVEDYAAREAKAYTERFCPTPPVHNTRTDSVTVDKATRTYNYYTSLLGPIDNDDYFRQNGADIERQIALEISDDTSTRRLKKAKFSFRFIIRSDSQPDKVYYDHTFTPEEYNLAK